MSRTLDEKYFWSSHSEARNKITNAYEPLQPYFLLELCRQANISAFLDVGANIGFYSILLASELRLTSVYAYEPISKTFEELSENIRLNGLRDNVSAMKIALSDSVGRAEMHVMGELSGANSIGCTSIHAGKAPMAVETVDTSTIDEQLSARGELFGLKIDVEGHEVRVIQGGQDFFCKNGCIIQVENYAGRDPVEALIKLGYKKILTIGPDNYLTNIEALTSSAQDSLEAALERFVGDSTATPARLEKGPIRRHILPGVTVEFSKPLSSWLRTRLK